MRKVIKVTGPDRAEVRLDDNHVLHIHTADEGLILDVWPDGESDGSIWSTYHFYQEMLEDDDD